MLKLSADDNRRKEAEQCPRCRSLLRQYIEFSSGTIDEEKEAAGVRLRLDRFLDEKIRRGGGSLGRREDNFWIRFTKWIRIRPALTAAAVVASVLLIGILAPWQGGDVGEIILRGDDDEAVQFELSPADMSVPDQIQLRWARVPAAESYRVVIYDASFNELVSTLVTDTILTVPVSELTNTWQTTPALQWEVEALRHGDVVNRSKTGILEKP
jgi:hypothetical protein